MNNLSNAPVNQPDEVTENPWCAIWNIEHDWYDEDMRFGATREEAVDNFRADPPEWGWFAEERPTTFNVFRRRRPRPVWDLIRFDDGDVEVLFEDISERFPEEYAVRPDGDDLGFLPLPDTARYWKTREAWLAWSEREAPKRRKREELAALIEPAIRACVKQWCESNGYSPTTWVASSPHEEVPFEENHK